MSFILDEERQESALIHVNQICASPYRENHLSDEEKMKKIAFHFSHILETMGLDLSDDSIRRTPHRFAKMLVKELFWGLNGDKFPKIMTQENKFDYHEMLVEANISIQSVCEHHFVPILGFCHIAYFPKDRIIGLSKLNRIAQYFGRRPQVQERMTKQIRESLVYILQTEDVAVVVDALHLCVRMRGVQDTNALTRSSDSSGKFLDQEVRREFFATIPTLKDVKL
jgi:GTP cyclohydrolase IA